MNLISLKFLAAGFIAVGLMLLSMAIGAGWTFCTRQPQKSAPGGSRHHPDRKNHAHQRE